MQRDFLAAAEGACKSLLPPSSAAQGGKPVCFTEVVPISATKPKQLRGLASFWVSVLQHKRRGSSEMPRTLPCPRRAVAERAEGLRAGGDGDVAESTRELLSTLLQTNPFALRWADPGRYVLCSHPAKKSVQGPEAFR